MQKYTIEYYNRPNNLKDYYIEGRVNGEEKFVITTHNQEYVEITLCGELIYSYDKINRSKYHTRNEYKYDIAFDLFMIFSVEKMLD